MRYAPRGGPATTADWPELAGELDRWAGRGHQATLWWRDDDAVAATPALDRLMAVAGDVPLALAVIPAMAEPDLATALARASSIAVLQHGWRHASHAGAEAKSEFPGSRAETAVAADLAAGRARLDGLFGDRAIPVLAAPWNRFDARFLPLLPACGLRGLSRCGPRTAPSPLAGIAEINTHVDVVAWRAGRGFIGTPQALGGIVRHLRGRRLGEVDADEPTGILTHHLIADAETLAFLSRLRTLIDEHPAARWASAAALFGG